MPDNPTPQGFNFDEILAAINATPDAAPGDPIADAPTEEQAGLDIDHAAGDIPLPGESTPTTTGYSYKGPRVAVEARGVTDQGIERSRGLFGGADARIASRVAEDAARSEELAEISRQHFGDVGDALDLAIRKTQEFQERDAQLQQQVIAFNRGAAELEQRLAGEAQAERAQYLAAYKEQLSLVKQLALQSGNPMGQLSRGEAIGLAGAQFAQGFLAAQGVNIDVAGQVDRWVERSIAEHQMKIQNARASAEDQLHFYEIARQNSMDEWEARQRYRGFVVAGLQAAIHLNASRFQSDVAMARAQEQIARLQIEADATERAIGDAHFNRVAQIYQSEYQRAYQMGQLSIEQRRLALQAEAQAWDMDPRNPKNAVATPILPETFIDPEGLTNPDGTPLVDPATGNRAFAVRWRVKRGLNEKRANEVAKEAQERVGAYSEFLAATRELQQSYLAAKAVRERLPTVVGMNVSKVSWEAAARMDKTGTIEKFLQDRRTWVIAKVKSDSGLSVTDRERRFHEENAFLDKLLSRDFGGKGEKLYANLSEAGRKGFEARMSALPLEPVEQGAAEWRPPAAPRTAAQNQATLFGEEPLPGFAETQMAKALVRDSEDIERRKVSGAWADFKGWDVGKLKKTASGEIKASEAAREFAKQELESGQPEYAVAVDNLAAAYARPHFFRVHSTNWGVRVEKDESAKEIREGAYKAISNLALGNTPDGGRMPGELMEYAGWVKRKIDEDPELSKALEHDEDVTDSPFIKRLNWRSED